MIEKSDPLQAQRVAVAVITWDKLSDWTADSLSEKDADRFYEMKQGDAQKYAIKRFGAKALIEEAKSRLSNPNIDWSKKQIDDAFKLKNAYISF